MYYRQHQWIDIPHTAYERRRELRVRESKHTVMLWDKKYYNIDTGKYDTDRIHTINSCLLVDIMSEHGNSTDGYQDELIHENYDLQEKVRKAEAKERRLRLKKERQIQMEQRELRELRELEEQLKVRRQREIDKRKEEEEYDKLVQDAQRRIAEEAALRNKIGYAVYADAEQEQEDSHRQPMMYIGGPNHGKVYGYIIGPKWK